MAGFFFTDTLIHGVLRELYSEIFYLLHLHYFSLKPCQQTLEITLAISESEGSFKPPGAV